MSGKMVTLSFRVSGIDASAIREKADRCGVSISAFIRESALQRREVFLPQILYDKLDGLDSLNRRVGTNINQIARAVNKRGYFPRDEYQDLMRQLQTIDHAYTDLISKIQEMKDGNLKADAAEGDIGKTIDTLGP